MEEEDDSCSEIGEMEAGLQIDTGAVLLVTPGKEVLEVLVNGPMLLLAGFASLTGEDFLLTVRVLFCVAGWDCCCCCCCWRHFARRFLNHTYIYIWRERERERTETSEPLEN